MSIESGTVQPIWANWPERRLLELRLCDLQLTVSGDLLRETTHCLLQELQDKRLRFRPHFWLSDEWFCPDGVPGIAIPFYLAHPRLARLERAQMLEVEGGTTSWCMRLLRHEAGHAIENAYRLKRRGRRQELFGSSSVPYPDHYSFKPYSRSFVQYLDIWYAQSHPDEDFAETFAVWLDPDSQWRQRYAGTAAMKKLQYMDELMQELRRVQPPVRRPVTVDPIERLEKTLSEHYRWKRAHYGVEAAKTYDLALLRLFTAHPKRPYRMSAADFLQRIRKDVRRTVAEWTGQYQYTIDQVIEDMIERCQALDLKLVTPIPKATVDFAVVLTRQALHSVQSGRHRVAV
ncbi:MAG: putative zinc-binding metallopeptidase [Nitrospiraceae bacterium]